MRDIATPDLTPPAAPQHSALELAFARFLQREAFGMPMPLVACAAAAVVFGGLLAIVTG